MKQKAYGSLLIAFLILFHAVAQAHAATLYLLPEQNNLSIGQEFSLDLKIDSGSASTTINSAQATIQFPVSVLSVVGVDKQSSTFGFWLEEPVASNDSGTVHFIGGAIRGVAGSALQVLRIKFKVTGAGPAELKISDSAVTAADGKGTNILSETKGASVLVGTKAIAPAPSTSPAATNTESLEKVERVAVKATGLPMKPALRVPLYPDESRWYNRVGDVIVLWDPPADVTQVTVRLSHAKDTVLGVPEKELFNGKSFGLLQEGIWYVKVQFKNNVGWSEPAYYKISIDTTPPLPFDVEVESAASDDPSPTVQFETSDSLSGIAGYAVSLDGKELAVTTSTAQKLPAQSPNKHSLTVTASDRAGNAIQDAVAFEVLPLPTPEVEFLTPSIAQGEFVFVFGKGPLGGSVEILVVDKNGREILRDSAEVGSDGRWDMVIKEPFATGQYLFSATAHDERGALSAVSVPQLFRVKARTIISFGLIELSWPEILIIIILVIAVAVSLWSLRYLRRTRVQGAYKIILGRDVEKLSDLLIANIKDLSQVSSVKSGVDAPQFTHLIGKMTENVEKIKEYITQEVRNLK